MDPMERMALLRAMCSLLCMKKTQIFLFPWSTTFEVVLEAQAVNMVSQVMAVLEVEVVHRLPGNPHSPR